MVKYVNLIGVRSDLEERINQIYKFYAEFCSYEIKDIFISEYLKEDGSREFESLWLFSDKYYMEAKNFTKTEEYDAALINNNIIKWDIKKEKYDFVKAHKDSRLNVGVITESTSCNLKASGENCDQLRDIFIKYVITNMK